MKFFVLILVVLVSMCNACSRQHTVQSGESCWKISTDNGMTLDSLRSANPGLNCDQLWVGSKVCISGSSGGPSGGFRAADTPGCSRTYTVVQGDFCYKIWTNNGLSEQQFRSKNGNVNCDQLSVGQQICL